MSIRAKSRAALLTLGALSMPLVTGGCTNRPYGSAEEQAQNACQALGPKAMSGALIGTLGGAAGGAGIGAAAGGGRGAAIGAGVGALAGLIGGLVVGRNMDARDCAQAQVALAQLRYAPIGQAVSWTSASGSYGSYTPVSAEYAAVDNRLCRRVNLQTTLNGREPVSSAGVTCRQPDGDYTTVQPVSA